MILTYYQYNAQNHSLAGHNNRNHISRRICCHFNMHNSRRSCDHHLPSRWVMDNIRLLIIRGILGVCVCSAWALGCNPQEAQRHSIIFTVRLTLFFICYVDRSIHMRWLEFINARGLNNDSSSSRDYWNQGAMVEWLTFCGKCLRDQRKIGNQKCRL